MVPIGNMRELLTDERAAMEAYKREFIEFMVESDVLKFGEFTLKSGRKSPFFMNAGAYGSEMKNVLVDAVLLTKDGAVIRRTGEELELGYRTSNIPTEGLTVLEAEVRLQPGDKTEILRVMNDLAAKRREKQPLEYPSAGSTFKRGTDFITAKLIDECGLKGYQIGGAQVSEKHAGFIINKGNATSKDVEELIKYIKQKVYEKFGKEIETEIEIIH